MISKVPLDTILSQWVRDGIGRAFPDMELQAEAIRVAPTTNPEHGDYQCNAAMGWARILKRSPREIAQAVVAASGALEGIERVEVAGAGFINIHLAGSWLADYVTAMGRDATCGVPAVGRGRTVIIDYSSPNVAKPMHIGHIRSTVIGNALDRIHRFLGYRVLADNHLGDWGTQFGILIMGYRHFLDRAALQQSPIDELERLYIKSYEQSRQSAEWLAQARQELVKLQQGDAENLRLWKDFVALSLEEFEKIYARLEVTFDLRRGESYYNGQLPVVLERLREAGLARESEGAMVAFLEEDKLPTCIVRKSDGAFNYTATDVATVIARTAEFQPEKIIYVTDERQQLHFRQVFAICRRLGIATRLEHVWFGLMRLPEGTFSTREGNVIKLERLLDEAEKRALSLVQANNPEMPPASQQEVARAIGIGAVKYADLSQNPQSVVTFSWEKALSLTGNSAPYLQYACARIASVQTKYRERFPDQDLNAFPLVVAEPIERQLLLAVARFPETLVRVAEHYKPSILADYLYELSGIYSNFYQNVPFLKAEAGIRESRVRLCGIIARVLSQGLALLGIHAPERI